MRNVLLVSLTALLMSIAALGASDISHADQPPKKTETQKDIILVAVLISLDTPSGPQDFYLSGRLHLDSEVSLAADGTASGFKLHANLSNTSIVSAVSSDPGTCSPAPVPPSPIPMPYPLLSCGATGAMNLTFDPGSVRPDGFTHDWGLTFEVSQVRPRDASTGLPTGRRLYFSLDLQTAYGGGGELTGAVVVQHRGGCPIACAIP